MSEGGGGRRAARSTLLEPPRLSRLSEFESHDAYTFTPLVLQNHYRKLTLLGEQRGQGQASQDDGVQGVGGRGRPACDPTRSRRSFAFSDELSLCPTFARRSSPTRHASTRSQRLTPGNRRSRSYPAGQAEAVARSLRGLQGLQEEGAASPLPGPLRSDSVQVLTMFMILQPFPVRRGTSFVRQMSGRREGVCLRCSTSGQQEAQRDRRSACFQSYPTDAFPSPCRAISSNPSSRSRSSILD